jgi:putative addiction module component (TIGR02574 family)
MDTLSAVREQALALDFVSRASLIEDLLLSLDPTVRQRIDAAWAAEADRRVEAYDRGESAAISLDDVRVRFGIA